MLTDASTLRVEFGVPRELSDQSIDAVIAEASRYVAWTVDGDAITTKYADAQTDYDADPDDLEVETADLQRAEKHYAMYLVIMRFGVRFRRDGFVKKQQDAGSPAISSGSQITNEYWSAKEIRDWAAWYLQQAVGILNDYSWNLGPVTMGTIQIA